MLELSMELQSVWILILAISTPIAGIVGFAIQLRNVKKLRLENKKLELEIIRIERETERADRRIIEPTNEEVYKINNDILFSEKYKAGAGKKRVAASPAGFSLLLGLLFLVSCFLYGSYRAILWVVEKL